MKNNDRLVFEPMGVAAEVPVGKTVLEAAIEKGIKIRSDCGGKGLCGKCLVVINPGENTSPITEVERERLSHEQLEEGYRLACQAEIKGPLRINIPSYATDSSDAIGKDLTNGVFQANPMVERLFLKKSVAYGNSDKGPMDFSGHITRRVFEELGKKVNFSDLHSLRSISRPFAHQSDITLVNHKTRGITEVFEGTEEKSLGVALDLGTTTLAAYLCDLRRGELLNSFATANPQRSYGEDVISRISYANEDEKGLEMLKKSLIGGVNRLIEMCCKAAGASKKDIDEVTVVGNTTMEQSFSGVHLNGLGFAPYLPVSREPGDMKASELGMDLNPGTNVHIFPVISGFVGGDTMGAIIAERPHERDEISLIVDIGTNGEVVLGNREGLWVTSCATGPALEGAHIECGMRASEGAIHRLRIESRTHEVSFDVIGSSADVVPQGLCGSAIIDTVAEMLRNGIMLPSGRLKEGNPRVICDEKGIGRKFILVPSTKGSSAREIAITLSDIRQIQLAKGALYTGVKLLMRMAGIDHVDRMVLTGAFGARFDWRNAVAIGMLPDGDLCARVETVENAAGMGAIKALIDGSLRENALRLLPKIRFIELAEEKDFPTEFAMAMAFPPPKDQT